MTPTDRPGSPNSRTTKIAWTLCAIALALAIAGEFLQGDQGDEGLIEGIALMLGFASFPVLGALIAGRQPRNPLAWIFLGLGLILGIGFFGTEYARVGLVENPGSLPLATAGAWLEQWYWLALIGPIFTFVPLLFPDGRLPSSRWRPLAWVTGVAAGILIGGSMLENRLVGDGYNVDNPIGIPGLKDVEESWGPLLLLLGVCGVLCVVSLIFRFRGSTGETRHQLKWFTYAAVIFIAGSFLGDTLDAYLPNWLFSFQLLLLPIAIGIAILKYRLYEIDVVINKTIVFGGLAAFITGIYVAIVVGIGTALGSSDKPNLALSITATAVVAIAFSPVKERVQRFANRLVYGKRVTPYEALAAFTDQVASSYETREVAPAMAATIAEATGAAQAHVWLVVGPELVRVAAHPDDGQLHAAVSLNGKDEFPEIPGVDVVVPVVHRGELLGGLSLNRARGEDSSPADQKLLSDLAAQAGIVLRNTRLIAELSAHLDQITTQASEIRSSRQRIVAAQDLERKRLERDIHDGAQQHLVALAVKLNLAKTMTQRKPERAQEMLVQLKGEAREALETLGDLAKGIYPPLLAEKGIAQALRNRADKAPFEVEIRDETYGRYSKPVEAAVYFSSLEALQNVAKYANATRVSVILEQQDGELVFTVTDDGDGFDPATTKTGSGIAGMADRIATVGGDVEITSVPGQGTTVRGRVPIRILETV
jgi:signal transduction histidine kinase